MLVRAGALALATGAVLVALVGPAAPPAAADNPLCSSVSGTAADPVTMDSAPLGLLGVHQAQLVVAHDAPHGRPVRVAVLDSGVTGDRIPVAGRVTDVTGHREVTYYHGTAVAGLIAGQPRGDGKPVGIAPDAEIVDVRVYDDVDPDQGDVVTADRVAAGLEWVAGHADALNIKVADVSLVVGPSARLARAVRDARRAGVVVVAASGNRPEQGAPFDDEFADGSAAPGEDAAGILFPTSYPGVVSASSTADGSGSDDVTEFVLQNSRTTVAVPTFDAVSYGIDGRPCVLEPPATSWAAAEVSGVLALLWQRYPHDTAAQIVARLVNTATGTPDDRSPLIGAGVVQPVEALTRPLDPSRSGEVERTVAAEREAPRAQAPTPADDLLAGARDTAVWWGLIGGGALVVALLLRPVLARRR